MAEPPDDIRTLIDSIRERTTSDLATSGAVAALNLIPYVGGAIASLLGEFASNRRIEKICEVLSELDAGLRRNAVSAERFLSKDQVIELVYDTLRAVSITSDRESSMR